MYKRDMGAGQSGFMNISHSNLCTKISYTSKLPNNKNKNIQPVGEIWKN